MLETTMITKIINGEVVQEVQRCKDKNKLYKFIKEIRPYNYKRLPFKQKTEIVTMIMNASGYSRIQVKRLLNSNLTLKYKDSGTRFKAKYTQDDINLLAELDRNTNYVSGFALQKIIKRQYEVFKDERFKNLSSISNGSIYKFRLKYRNKYKHTIHSTTNIGERRKPVNLNLPGYIRVDTVHGGDKDNVKGVYYINLVDEVTQYEYLCCVPEISERYLKSKWEQLLSMFPFPILNFHSDNGSEFINYVVRDILNRLNITQTKSRPRHSNDNGLVECKNGWVIRKHFGYIHREKESAPVIDEYIDKYFNYYLNYHRVCAYPHKEVLKSGKVILRYPSKNYMTPFDKLKEIDTNKQYLKDGVTYGDLEMLSKKYDTLSYTKLMNKEYLKMINSISNFRPLI